MTYMPDIPSVESHLTQNLHQWTTCARQQLSPRNVGTFIKYILDHVFTLSSFRCITGSVSIVELYSSAVTT